MSPEYHLSVLQPCGMLQKKVAEKTHVEEHQHTAQHLQLRHRNVVMTGEHLILLQKTLFQREREREKTAKNKRIFQIQ